MATLQKVGVVLTNPKDWDEWLETIKTASMKTGVWGYINPALADPPILVPPVRPVPNFIRTVAQAGSGVVPQTTPRVSTRATSSQTAQPSIEASQPIIPITYGSLTDDQKEELRNLQADFQYDRKIWEKQEEAIQGLWSKIQETIRRDFLPYTYNCDTPYEMLVRLKERFAPTTRARLEEWRSEWAKASKIQRGVDLEEWLLKWETLYTQGRTLRAPEVIDPHDAIYYFLKAIGPCEF
ncbi:hypothetical protein GMDG_05075 [Pseudogymnoascus destructans 20631-21]|uniref:Uncharacterized protein n=1 Tax=Pseudogymnoascus destructans (strain ATCC MYA-4855 / 20631-21) TaxID=658429 RepID=L8FN36_PSED2|nr:hypothetical protein GMDG_05075 [Pseudogymnoascus destructans 20631-21]